MNKQVASEDRDRNKQVAALATDDGTMVMWDIDALLLKYQHHPYITVKTEELTPKDWLTIDRRYALTTDVTKPLLLFELPDRQLFIADGNHRLYRAVTEQVKEMRVIVIPQEEHLAYLFQSTTASYFAVMDALKDAGIFIRDFVRK